MSDSLRTEIAVVGGGIIGLASAFRLAEAGREVLVIDTQRGGLGTSEGNAGTIATYNCVPTGTPSVLRHLPQLLLYRDSPFAMRWASLPALSPWLIRFVAQSLPRRARANAAALAGLLRDTASAWRDLAGAANASDLLQTNGCLYIYGDEPAFAASRWEREQRTAGRVRQIVLGPSEVAQLEPALSALRGPALLFPDAMHITDPSAMLGRIRDAAVGRGVRFAQGNIAMLRIAPGAILLDGPGISVAAERVLVAAGAWSRDLAHQVGDNIPLETERGYHVEYPMDALPLSRPVAPIRFGVYLTPMAGRLRAAGTVELGGLALPQDPRRPALVDRAARSVLPGLPPPREAWLGFRPSLPDSLPVIGRATTSDRIVYAFGHGHLGLTLSAVTARYVVDVFIGVRAPSYVSPQRFGH